MSDPTAPASAAERDTEGDAPAALTAPVAPTERVTRIDALRGAALLGILLVNMLAFSGPYTDVVPALSYWTGAADRAVEWGIAVVAEGSFYTLFSALFGLGFALQLARAEARGEDVAPRWRRRLAILLGIGLVHAALIWYGDILTQYALVGFLLLPLRRRTAAGLFRLALGLLVVANLIYLALGPVSAPQPDAAAAAADVALYRDGGFAEILAERGSDAVVNVVATVVLLPGLLALFLFGAVAGRTGLLYDPERHRRTLGTVVAVALPVGLVCKGFYGWLILTAPGHGWSLVLATGLGGPAMGIAYGALLMLLWTRREPPAALAAVGRMALTNYLTHSVVFTLVFYGYGLGFYGRFGPATTLLFTLGMFALQLALSPWWLARFRFGPVEWLWRSLTYGRVQPWRRGAG